MLQFAAANMDIPRSADLPAPRHHRLLLGHPNLRRLGRVRFVGKEAAHVHVVVLVDLIDDVRVKLRLAVVKVVRHQLTWWRSLP